MSRLIAKRLVAMLGVLLFLAAAMFTLQHNTPERRRCQKAVNINPAAPC